MKILLLASLLAGLPATAAAQAGSHPVRTYWRDEATLWVYSAVPEVGITSNLGDPTALGRVRDAGARLVRLDLPWNASMEDRPYHYTGAFYGFRWALDNARRAGLVPVVVVHAMGPGAGPPGLRLDLLGERNRPEFNRRFAAYMAEAARSFPEVRFWEIWNETDGGYWGMPFGEWDARADQFPRRRQGRNYAAMLREVYPAIKRANPRAWVVMGGLTGTERLRVDGRDASGAPRRVVANEVSWEFLNGVYDGGGAPFFDFMAVHSYALDSRGGRWNGLDSLGVQVARVMAAREGKAGRPVWITEMGQNGDGYVGARGWPHERGLNDGDTFDSYQADWYRRALDLIAAPGSPYTKALAYALWEKAPLQPGGVYRRGRTSSDYDNGLFYDDWTPRPAYNYLRQRRFNAPLAAAAATPVEVRVRAPDRRPVGVRYTRQGADVILHSVRVDPLVPTTIRFEPGT